MVIIGGNYYRFGSIIFRPAMHVCEALLFLGATTSLDAQFSSEKQHTGLSAR